MSKRNLNIVSTLLLSAFIVACSASGGPGKSKQKEFATQGCIGGGILGAVAVTALGSGENAGKAALFGCGIGAVIGYTIAKRTENYINASDAISLETKRNIETVNLVRSNNQKLATRITKFRSTINTIEYSKITQESKQRELTNISKSLKEQLDTSNSNLASLDQELKVTRGLYSKYKSSALNTEDTSEYLNKITELETEKNILNEHVQSLSAMNASI